MSATWGGGNPASSDSAGGERGWRAVAGGRGGDTHGKGVEDCRTGVRESVRSLKERENQRRGGDWTGELWRVSVGEGMPGAG